MPESVLDWEVVTEDPEVLDTEVVVSKSILKWVEESVVL